MTKTLGLVEALGYPLSDKYQIRKRIVDLQINIDSVRDAPENGLKHCDAAKKCLAELFPAQSEDYRIEFESLSWSEAELHRRLGEATLAEQSLAPVNVKKLDLDSRSAFLILRGGIAQLKGEILEAHQLWAEVVRILDQEIVPLTQIGTYTVGNARLQVAPSSKDRLRFRDLLIQKMYAERKLLELSYASPERQENHKGVELSETSRWYSALRHDLDYYDRNEKEKDDPTVFKTVVMARGKHALGKLELSTSDKQMWEISCEHLQQAFDDFKSVGDVLAATDDSLILPLKEAMKRTGRSDQTIALGIECVRLNMRFQGEMADDAATMFDIGATLIHAVVAGASDSGMDTARATQEKLRATHQAYTREQYGECMDILGGIVIDEGRASELDRQALAMLVKVYRKMGNDDALIGAQDRLDRLLRRGTALNFLRLVEYLVAQRDEQGARWACNVVREQGLPEVAQKAEAALVNLAFSQGGPSPECVYDIP
jgi:hypothetical protein